MWPTSHSTNTNPNLRLCVQVTARSDHTDDWKGRCSCPGGSLIACGAGLCRHRFRLLEGGVGRIMPRPPCPKYQNFLQAEEEVGGVPGNWSARCNNNKWCQYEYQLWRRTTRCPASVGKWQMILVCGCAAVERQPRTRIMMSDKRHQVRDSIGVAGGRMRGWCCHLHNHWQKQWLRWSY